MGLAYACSTTFLRTAIAYACKVTDPTSPTSGAVAGSEWNQAIATWGFPKTTGAFKGNKRGYASRGCIRVI